MQKIIIKFQKLGKVLTALEAIYLKPNQPDRSNIDATIQRFEFTFELFWKCLKELFNQEELGLNYPKEVFQEAFSVGLIDNEQTWVNMLQDRNMTSHTYNEALADAIFERIKEYTPLIRKSYDRLEKIILPDGV
jgi:nucleotidyltransferase substrate binding protein (TIGR01987 family)